MKNLSSILLLFLTSCGHGLVRDTAPASIDVGHKRVETVICGNYAVGENGCVFKDGVLEGDLQIYKILSGHVTLIAQGCGIDKSFEYVADGSEWISLPLKALIEKDKIEDDCVLAIYQRVDFPKQAKAPFPIQGIYGTVSLGTCPDGVSCSFKAVQERAGWALDVWEPLPDWSSDGLYSLRGCGKEIVPPSQIQAPLRVNLQALWPSGYPVQGKTGCLFVLGVKGADGKRFKLYQKVWLFREEAIRLGDPAISQDGQKIVFQGDSSISLTIVGKKAGLASSGKFKPSPEGDFLRFYTVQGRSLVVFVKEGKIVWAK